MPNIHEGNRRELPRKNGMVCIKSKMRLHLLVRMSLGMRVRVCACICIVGRILDTKFLQIDWSFGTLSKYIEIPMFEGKMVYTRLIAVRSSQLMAVGLAILRKKNASSQM